MKPKGWLACLALVLAASTAWAGSRFVLVNLRLQPELALEGTEKIFVGPVLLEPAAEDAPHSVDLTAVREFDIYLRRIIKRQTRLTLLPAEESLRPPTNDPIELAKAKEFWTELGKETGAQYIASAFIDVEVLDRAGYQTEEYVSPTDGKTYFRQRLVEETGFSFDILLMVVNGVTGEVVHQEQITDFKERSERKLQEYTDMFNDLYNLENRLLGVFVPRTVQAKRYLYKG